MRGDFSSFWQKEEDRNFNGVLHQQGRVLLDRDWNAQAEIVSDWQTTAAADIIGAGVAAVPADAVDSFKVTGAEIKTAPNRIEIKVNGGRVWADGLLIESAAAAVSIAREATYLEPPVQDPQAAIPNNPPNTPLIRDAVILEAWHEELSAFQIPELLIEPALGGVDTTERFQTAYRFRLYRMDADDTCDSIIGQLADKFADKGKLTAVLEDDTTVDEDCPVAKGGGYTGFEHQLYRIEIAQTKHVEKYFKWSQFNGGLVGRGTFDSPNRKVRIDANLNAILHSDLTSFYLETLEEKNGYWQVTFGAKATLDTADNSLTIAPDAQVHFNTVAAMDGKKVFFRLWNDLRKIADFDEATETPLQDGIKLKFQPDASGRYTPHDFWTFEVRAGEFENPKTLIGNLPPQGIFYHRVPLAELNWRKAAIDDASGDVEDCRRIFQPLTKLRGCCTYRVGDGVNSHGDFTSIQTAIDHLPKKGGQICVLPGEYRENIVLSDATRNRNVTIKGCGSRTRIFAANGDPLIHVAGGVNLKFESMALMADAKGIGILLEGDETVASEEDRENRFGALRNVSLENLRIVAATRSAIEMHVGQYVSIRNCQMFIEDADSEWQAAVYLAGDDLLFEENDIRVMTTNEKSSFGKTDDPQAFTPAGRAAGGLHLAGGCERVRVINNLIIGGTGNGITLGSVDVETTERVIKHIRWQKKSGRKTDKCDHQPGVIIITTVDEETRFIAGDPLRDILIERNRIFAMGLNGIGVDGFFVMETDPNSPDRREQRRIQFISVENLTVIGNRIEFCLNNLTTELPPEIAGFAGFGGLALSDVGNLVVRDNFIESNGASPFEPVCGIFVLFGRGTEISRNRILNNGRPGALLRNDKLKNGARGGIFILFAADGVIQFGNFNPQTTNQSSFRRLPSGVPALKMHENVVTAPTGRALTISAIGNIAVSDNELSSQSLVPEFDAASFLAATVFIFSFNVSNAIQTQPQSFTAYRKGQVKPTMKTADAPGRYTQTGAATVETIDTAAVSARVPILPASGAVHFGGNRCRQIGIGSERTLAALSSILILSLGDIGFLGNQTECALLRTRLLTDTLIFGVNVRAGDNSWQETPGGVLFSAATLGGNLNTTTDNQSTHCLFVFGRLFIAKHNLTLFDLANGMVGEATRYDRTPCQARGSNNILSGFGQKTQVTRDSAQTNPDIRIINQ